MHITWMKNLEFGWLVQKYFRKWKIKTVWSNNGVFSYEVCTGRKEYYEGWCLLKENMGIREE